MLPVTVTPSFSTARTCASLRSKATEAPTPTSSPEAFTPSSFSGIAVVVVLVPPTARRARSPPSRSRVVAPRTSAVVSTSNRLTETEPATPTSLPPAPDRVFAVEEWLASTAPCMRASMIAPSAEMAAPPPPT
ncbi:MAG: hypothetical protein B7Z52_04210, partial [Burkholderiales bacterium 12-64-5]